MASPTIDRITEWEGGSLGELVAALQTAAQPVRIEVIAPGAIGGSAGEVHLLAGGLADAVAGSLRRDDAVAALQRIEGARFLVEARLPDPDSGSLAESGPCQGSLKDRPLAALMRYCEDYVLTCQVEIARGEDHAVISYRRGEITATAVNGADGEERLPEVLAWTEGSYQITLPALALPATGVAKPAGDAPGKPERKRHTTLPMLPTSRPAATSLPGQGTGPPLVSSASFQSPAPKPTVSTPPSPSSVPLAPLRLPPPPQAPVPAASPAGAFPSELTKRGIPPVPPAPVRAAATSARLSTAPATPLAMPTGPAAQPLPPAAAPALAQPKSPLASPKPAASLPAPAGKPATPIAATAAAKPAAAPVTAAAAKPVTSPPATAGKPVPSAAIAAPKATAAGPALPARPAGLSAVPPAAKTAAATARAATPPRPIAASPAAPARPVSAATAPQPAKAAASSVVTTKPETPVAPAKPVTAPGTAAPKLTPARPAPAAPEAVAANLAPTVPQPARPAMAPAEPGQPPAAPELPAPPPPPANKPATSNDLRPASGTIEVKPKRPVQAKPAHAPVEVAEEPPPPPARPPTRAPAPVHAPVPAHGPAPARAVRPRAASTSARKKPSEHSVRFYVLMGFAIGLGIVLAYWFYQFFPYGHR